MKVSELQLASALLVTMGAGALSAAGAWAQDLGQERPPPDAPAPAPPAPRLTKAPVLLSGGVPAYPPDALAARISGQVTLQIDIDPTGDVSAVAVIGPGGHGFDEAAVAAARDMKFSPAEIDGRVAAIRIEYVMHFVPRLEAVDGGAAPDGTSPSLGADGGAGAVPASDGGAGPDGGGAGGDASGAAEQVVLVRGRIREKGTREPLVGADVAVSRFPAGSAGGPAPAVVVSATDADGRFEVRGRSGEPIRIIIGDGSHELCVRDFASPASAPSAPPVEIACTVAPRTDGQYETRVRASRPSREVIRHTLDQAELTTVPGTFGDPLRVVQNLPGVARVPYGLGQLIVRGASPQDSGVYVGGHRVPLLYHFLGGPSVLTPRLIDRIDFYPGGFSVRYGRVTGGIIDVTTPSTDLRRLHGSGDFNLLDSAAYVEGPLGHGISGAVAARRSYIDLLLPLVLPHVASGNAATAVVVPVYWDYQARLDRSLGSWGKLGLFAFGSDDYLRVVTVGPGGDVSVSTRIGFHRLTAAWAAVASNGWVTRVSPSLGVDILRFDGGLVTVDRVAWVAGLRGEASRPIGSRATLIAGVDAELRLDQLEGDLPIPDLRRTYGMAAPSPAPRVIPLQTAAAALYLEAPLDLTDRLRLVPGLRGDVFRYVGQDRLSADPRLVVRWAQTPRLAFKAGAGIFHQMPEPQLLWAERGNPHLALIWSDQYHLGVERRFSDAVTLDATIYALRRHNVPVVSPTSGFDSSGRGRGYGLELILRHQITSHFYGWLAYTLARSEQTAVAVGLPPLMQPSGLGQTITSSTYFPTPFDQTHILNVVASYRFTKWEIGTRFRVATGIPQTPIDGSVYDADADRYRPISGAVASTRRPTFHQLDLRFERTFTFDAWRFSAYLDIQNIYNATNPEATQWDYRYRASVPVRGTPFLPVFGFRGRF